jgi:hypothetical protein
MTGGAADAEALGSFGDGELFSHASLYHNSFPSSRCHALAQRFKSP